MGEGLFRLQRGIISPAGGTGVGEISPSGASDFLGAQKVTKDAFKGRGISISPFP